MKCMPFLLLAFGMYAAAEVPPAQTLSLLRSQLPGSWERWDRMALDSAAQRIYMPGPTGVLVTDLRGKPVGEVAGIKGVHSVALAPELGIGIASNSQSSCLYVFNLTSLMVEKVLRTTGGQPGAVVFDPAFRRIFAFNERGRNATAFDAFGGAVAGSIPLGGTPGTAVADGRGHLFVGIKDTREVLLLDAWKLVVLHRWPVAAIEDPSWLALDPQRQRLFVVGANRLIAVLDSGTGRLLNTLSIAPGAEAAMCDPVTGGAYLPHRDGSITVINPDAAGGYRVEAGLPSRSGPHDHGC